MGNRSATRITARSCLTGAPVPLGRDLRIAAWGHLPSSRTTLAISSDSCSSEATERDRKPHIGHYGIFADGLICAKPATTSLPLGCWKHVRSLSSRVRYTFPEGKISNRNIALVNPNISYYVQLIGAKRQRRTGARRLARWGEWQVAAVARPESGWRRIARTTGRGCVMLAMLFCLVVAIFRFSTLGWQKTYYWPIRSVFGLMALALGFAYMRTSESVKRLDTPRDPRENVELIPLGDRQLQNLKKNASNARAMGLAEAQIFALATTYPAAVRQRISERYEPERRTMRQSVSIAIKIPKSQLGLLNGSVGAATLSESRTFSIPLPAVIIPKGELNDDFSVYSGGDEELPAYSYSEYLQLAARVLHVLLTNAFAILMNDTVSHSEDIAALELTESAQQAEDAALRCILNRGTLSESDIDEAASGIRNLKLPELPEHLSKELRQQSRDMLRLAAKFAERLSYSYAIVVPGSCGADGRISLRYERTVIPSLELSRRSPGRPFWKITIWPVRWSKDRLRLLLGARPVDLTVSLENACTCQSYHMMVVCPDGLYLRDQLVPHVNEYMRNNARPTNVPPYCRLRRRLGQPYAHFYARYFPEPKRRPKAAGQITSPEEKSLRAPYLHLTFYEVPPASIFRAALVAISTTLLIWLVGLVISHSQNGDPGTDAPAWLLAFPAVIAAWLGFDAPSRRLLEGTLGARLSLIYSAFSSVAASGLFMIYKAQLNMLHGVFPKKISILGVGQISWAVLLGLSVCNALYTIYFSFVRTWEFAHLSSRPVGQNSTIQEG